MKGDLGNVGGTVQKSRLDVEHLVDTPEDWFVQTLGVLLREKIEERKWIDILVTVCEERREHFPIRRPSPFRPVALRRLQ